MLRSSEVSKREKLRPMGNTRKKREERQEGAGAKKKKKWLSEGSKEERGAHRKR